MVGKRAASVIDVSSQEPLLTMLPKDFMKYKASLKVGIEDELKNFVIDGGCALEATESLHNEYKDSKDIKCLHVPKVLEKAKDKRA